MNVTRNTAATAALALLTTVSTLTVKTSAADFVVNGVPPGNWPQPDSSVGVAGYSIEDFEDSNLVAGLRIGWVSAAGTNPPASTLPTVFNPTQDPNGPVFGYAFTNGVWDGSRCLVNGRGNVSHPFNTQAPWGDVVLEFNPPARAVGFSLQQSENPIQLVVNGTALGGLQSLGGVPTGGGRIGYFTVRATGATPISRVVLDNGGGDGWVIDHLAFLPETDVPGYVVTPFAPDSWPRSDADLGITGFTIEDFEDTNLAAGLRISVSTPAGSYLLATNLPAVFNPTNDAFGTAFRNGVWDGAHGLLNTRDNQSHVYTQEPNWGDVTLHFSPPVRSVGFSMEDLEYSSTHVTVNGLSLGILGVSIPAPNGPFQRQGYLRIDAPPGQAISTVELNNTPGDGWLIDHLAFSTNPPPASRANLYIVGRNTRAIYGYHVTTNSADLTSELRGPRLSSPFGLAFSAAGEMFVGNLGAHPYIFEERPGYVTRYAWPYDAAHFIGDEGVGALVTPHFLAFRGDELLVADSGNDRVMRYRLGPYGEAATLPPLTHSGFINDAVRGVVARPDGTEVFVSQCHCGGVNNVRRFRVEPNGSFTDLGVLPGTFNNPHGMTFSPWGELFTANEDFVAGPASTNWFITRHVFNADGTVRANGSFSDPHLKFPHTLAFSPWGELFVTGTFASNVTRFVFTTNHEPVFSGSFSLPDDGSGLAFPPAGNCAPVANLRLTAAVSGNNVTLQFPATASDYALDWTTSLTPPIVWRPSYAPRAFLDANLQVSLPVPHGTNRAEFFRLRCPSGAVRAGRIVAAFDDWTLADIGFRPGDQPARFATNVAAWFTGNHPGRFLAYSTHPGYTGKSLADAMSAAGHSWQVTTATTFNLSNLLTYDAVFVGGDVVDTNVLAQYVEAGGNVYVFSGGLSANGQWNGFLGRFGLGFSGTTSGAFDYPITSSHPILAGVDHLYALNGEGDGSSVVNLAPGDARVSVIASYQGSGLIAIWDGRMPVAP